VPSRAKLTDEQVKKIRRRVRAGARLTDLAAEYEVNRKTIRRRLDALELAEAERA
jgi:DNA-binding GntR family transcriptional regulator